MTKKLNCHNSSWGKNQDFSIWYYLKPNSLSSDKYSHASCDELLFGEAKGIDHKNVSGDDPIPEAIYSLSSGPQELWCSPSLKPRINPFLPSSEEIIPN